MLTFFGVSTIIHNFYTINVEKKEGLTGLIDGFILMASPQGVILGHFIYKLKYFDWFLMQFSVMLGGMAIVMVGSIVMVTMKNESQVEA